MRKRCTAILALVVIGLVGVSIGGCETETGPQVDKEILDSLSPACQGQGVEQAAAYTGEPGLHPIVLLDSSGGKHSWTNKVPIEWWPASLNATELVACVDAEEEVKVEYCTYMGSGSRTRYQYKVDIRLVEAHTGRTLDESTVDGPKPPECPNPIPSGTRRDIKGDHVPFGRARVWLRPYVLGEE